MPPLPREERQRLLLAAAEASRSDDPDPTTRAETDGLIAGVASDPTAWLELEDRFGSALTFGTAGLRGLLGAGDNRMNRRVVARTTAGVCAYLAKTSPDARTRGVCVGFDGRHGSRALAREVCEIAWGAGFVVHAFEDVIPTPVLAFSVLDRAAVGGIVITASHNPAAYNGYKVYLASGAQLVSPHDRGIQAEIDRVGPVLALPRRTREEATAAGLANTLDGLVERYVGAVTEAVGRGAGTLQLKAAYTALHGVGSGVARRVFASIGATDVTEVTEQAEPDPDFPSVAFPNPEEPGALDRVLALGESTSAALALANDPDADRLAVAARDSTGRLAALSGNELGVLLTDHLLAQAPADGKNLVVTTIVSTPLVERIAAVRGARCERTLTGFKWIIGRALELEAREGLRLALGFEEALGYSIGRVVRDKDGIGAAAHVLAMAERYAQRGLSLHAALETLYREHGLCESSQRSFTRPGPEGLREIAAGMAKLRGEPPVAVAGVAVREVKDLIAGSAALPPSDVLIFTLEGEHRITVRPSGTEPKLKVYLDVWTTLAAAETLASARDRARALALQLGDAVADQLAFRRRS